MTPPVATRSVTPTTTTAMSSDLHPAVNARQINQPYFIHFESAARVPGVTARTRRRRGALAHRRLRSRLYGEGTITTRRPSFAGTVHARTISESGLGLFLFLFVFCVVLV